MKNIKTFENENLGANGTMQGENGETLVCAETTIPIKFGISKNQICLDVGIGFGKSHTHNLELIKNIDKVKIDGVAMLMALSSKRVVKLSTGVENDELIYGTIAGNILAVSGGANIIRVHNVKENVLSVKMADAVLRGKYG